MKYEFPSSINSDYDGYQPKPDDKFFFDTNIWIYLFCPLGNVQQDKIKKYDSFLKKIIESKAKIFVSALLISEFFNTYLRLELNISKNIKSKLRLIFV